MKIKVLASDIETDSYSDIYNCPIAKAVKRVIGEIYITVCPRNVYISEDSYRIPKESQIKLERMCASINPDNWKITVKEYGILEPKDFEIELIKN